MTTWYGISSVVFAVLLYFPLRKFMLALAVNRNQRKFNRALTDNETEKLRKKIYVFAAIAAVLFAFIYNKIIMFRFIGGSF